MKNKFKNNTTKVKKTMDLYIYVSTGYNIRRKYNKVELRDYEDNLPENFAEQSSFSETSFRKRRYAFEDLEDGRDIYDTAQELLTQYPVLYSIMNQSRDDAMHFSIKEIAEQNHIEFDEWDPIFRCQTLVQALTMLPNIVKICRKISWCNIWKDQDFSDMKIFTVDEKTYVFLNLEAESG